MGKIILIVGSIIILLGSAAALIFFGVINVPGVTPVKKWVVVPASKDTAGSLARTFHDPVAAISKQVDQAAKDAEKAAKKTAAPTEQPVDPTLGDTKLAALWNDLEIEQLTKITEKWQPAALAKVLAKMEGDQVTKYLDSLDPARADQICRAMQTQASKVVVDKASS